MDVTVLIVIATLICLLLAIPALLRRSSTSSEGGSGGGGRAVEANRGPGGRRVQRMRRPVRNDSDSEGEDEGRNEELEELEEAGVKIPDGKIGKKKMEKLQASV